MFIYFKIITKYWLLTYSKIASMYLDVNYHALQHAITSIAMYGSCKDELESDICWVQQSVNEVSVSCIEQLNLVFS